LSSFSSATTGFGLVFVAIERLRRVLVLPSLFGVLAARTGAAAVGTG